MFCVKCGLELKDESIQFCPKCGQKVVSYDTAEPAEPERIAPIEPTASKVSTPNPAPSTEVPVATPRKFPIAAIAVIAAALVAIIVILTIIARPKKFEFSPYIHINVVGFEGQGIATADIDTEGLTNALMNELSKSEADAQAIISALTISPYSIDGLSNGDLMSFGFRYDPSVAKQYKITPTVDGFDITKNPAAIERFVEELEEGSGIDLTDIVNFTVDGYNGTATAKLDIDQGDLAIAIMNAIGSDFNLSEWDSLTQLVGFAGDYEEIDDIVNAISVVPEEVTNVSNGDSIEFTFEIDEDALSEYKVAFILNDTIISNGMSAGEYTVDGLEQLEMINPFDYVEVGYKDRSPKGTLDVTYYDPFYIDQFTTYFNISSQTGLYNGMDVTFSLSDEMIDYFAKKGYGFTETEHTYVVEGLQEYIMHPAVAYENDDFYNEYIIGGTDVFEDMLSRYDSHSTPSYIGSIFVDNTAVRDWSDNILLIFYNVTVNDKPYVIVSSMKNIYINQNDTENIMFDEYCVYEDDLNGALGSLLSGHFGYKSVENAVKAVDTDWFDDKRGYAGTYWYVDGMEQWSEYPSNDLVYSR